jgi:hypothetical protein
MHIAIGEISHTDRDKISLINVQLRNRAHGDVISHIDNICVKTEFVSDMHIVVDVPLLLPMIYAVGEWLLPGTRQTPMMH